MATWSVVPFRPEHADGLTAEPTRPDEPDVWTAVPDGTPHVAATILRDGQPVAVGGFVMVEPGTASLWCACADELGRDGVRVARLMVRWLRDALARYDATRVVAHVRHEFTRGRRFIEWLGLEPVEQEATSTLYLWEKT